MVISFPPNRCLLKKTWTLQSVLVQTMTNIIQCPCVGKEPCVPDICDVGKLTEQPKVVIIGAGLAGLSAAQRLIQCGMNNVTILEAAPRPGGRIYTCDCERSPVDLGAQWIYGGCCGNMIFNLACQEGLIKYPVEKYSPYRGIYLTSQGLPIREFVLKKAIKEFDILIKKAKGMFKNEEGPVEDISLWKYLNKNIELILDKKFKKTERRLASKVMYCLTNDIKVRMGVNLNQIPLKKYGAYKEIPGGYAAISKGFTSILQPMISLIPQGQMMFKKAVTAIKWRHGVYDNKRAEIFCCDGTVMEADFVICTVSLGVLKRHHEELFCPHLPKSKIDAITKLGFGNVIKIFFEYDKPFWIPTEGKFRLTWSKDEMSKEDWISSVGLIEEAPSCGKSLLITIGGEEAYCLETTPAHEVVKRVTKMMHTFLSNHTIPYPKNILRSNWGHNAFTIGSVTYLGSNSQTSHITELASPLPSLKDSLAPVLLFAGEATADGYYGTVQGARLSGIREAERILMVTKRFQGRPKPDIFTLCK